VFRGTVEKALKTPAALLTYMAEEREEKGQKSKERFNGLIEMLARLASEKVYGPLDVLATTPSVSVALSSLYNAVRYVRNQGYPVPSEDEINAFLAISKKNPEVMREIAIKALIRAEKLGKLQQPQGQPEKEDVKQG
jgi:hypothetical protein